MAITSPNPYSVRPHPIKATLSSNYIDFTSSDTAGWAQQYVPDLLEKEAEVFGNRSISGLLEKVGAEEAMTSDQVIWSEQGRLHLSYVANHNSSTDGKLKLTEDADGNSIDGTGEGAGRDGSADAGHGGANCSSGGWRGFIRTLGPSRRGAFRRGNRTNDRTRNRRHRRIPGCLFGILLFGIDNYRGPAFPAVHGRRDHIASYN